MDLMHHTCLREYTAGMKMVSPPVAKGAVGDRPAPVKVVRPSPRALLVVSCLSALVPGFRMVSVRGGFRRFQGVSDSAFYSHEANVVR